MCTRVLARQETPHDTLRVCVSCAKQTGIFNGQRKTKWGKPKWKKKNSSSGSHGRQAVEFVLIQQTEFIDTRHPFLHLPSTPFMTVCRVKTFLVVIAFYPFSSGLFDMKCTQNSHLSLVHVIFWANKKWFCFNQQFGVFLSPIRGSSSSWALISVIWNDEQPSLHGWHSILYIHNILKTSGKHNTRATFVRWNYFVSCWVCYTVLKYFTDATQLSNLVRSNAQHCKGVQPFRIGLNFACNPSIAWTLLFLYRCA